MTDLIESTFHWLEEQLPGRVSRPDNDSYVAATAIWAKRVGRALRAVVHRPPPEAQSATQWKWNDGMPTNLGIVPRLSSFAPAAFVLVAVVNADTQSPATISVVIPPIRPGQARVWIYRGSQPTGPFEHRGVEAVTSGTSDWAEISTATLRPGITLLPAPPAWHLIPTNPLRSTLLPDRRHI